MSRKKWSTAGLVFVVALLVAGSTVVLAAGGIPDSNGEFWACYDKAGNVRLLPEGTSTCPRKWSGPVSWNQEGPQGPQGEPGPPGEPGPTVGGYVQWDPNPEDTVPLPPSGDWSHPLLKVENLPNGTYFGIASFELVTDSPSDVGVNCAVGNQMGHKMGSVPGGGAGQFFTLSGMMNQGTYMELNCFAVAWTGQWDTPPAPAPFVGMQRGSLEAIAVTLDGGGGGFNGGFTVNISTGPDGQDQYMNGWGWEGPVAVIVNGTEVLSNVPIDDEGSFFAGPDIRFNPTDHVVVSDGTNEKDLYLANLSVETIIGATGFVDGTCDVGMDVNLEYSTDDAHPNPTRLTSPCSDGRFEGKFADNELPNYPEGSYVEARQWDNDGDATQVDAWYAGY